MRKVEKIIKFDSKKCSDEVDALKAEISKRQLKITKYENKINVIKSTLHVNKKQLAQEVEAIQNVKAMVMEALKIGKAPSAGKKAALAQQVANLDKEGSGAKMVGVLTNIVESVGSGRMEYEEILKLLDQLGGRLKKAIGSDPVSNEIKTYENKITVEKGDIVEMKEKLQKLEAQCELRFKEFKEILVVLKLIKQKFGDIKIPNCKPMADEKDGTIQKVIRERDSLKSQLEAMTVALRNCQKTKPAHEKCQSDSSKCTAEKESLRKEVERLKTVESTVKEHTTVRGELEKKYAKCTSEKTTIEGKLTEIRTTLQTCEEKAKCTSEKTTITELQKHVKLLEVKVQLLDKCDAKYKAISLEKTELIRQLEKMSILHRQLEKCHFDASTNAKTCAANALESSKEHSKAIDRLTVHLKEISAQVKTLSEAAKCTTQIHKIEKYEKEVTIIKTETKSVVTQVEANLKGCEAQVQKMTTDTKETLNKISECAKTSDTCTQQLSTCKASHAICTKGHAETKAACAKVDAELKSCQSNLKIETSKVATLTKIKEETELKEKKLTELVTKLAAEEEELKKAIKELSDQIAKQQAEIEKKTAELKALMEKEKELTVTKTTLTKEVVIKTTRIEEIEKKMSELSAQLKTANEGGEELKKELDKLAAEKEDQLKTKLALDGKLEKLTIELKTQQEYRKAAQETLSQAKLKGADYEKQIAALTAKLEASGLAKAGCEKEKLGHQGKIKALEQELAETRKELEKCAKDNSELNGKLAVASEKAKCDPHKAAIRALRQSNNAKDEEIKGLKAAKAALEGELEALKAKLKTWEALIAKLKAELEKCTAGHIGCKTNVQKLETQMLGHLRAIKGHVANVARLEEKLAACQVELLHTKKQWAKDRKAYKVFKDNLLEQIARLIKLAKAAKNKFDVARAAMRNELKVQDSQWGVCRKEVLNYERMLGSGVVKAEKEKLKLYESTKKFADLKKQAEAKIAQATAEAAKAKAAQAAAEKARAELDKAYKRVNKAVDEDEEQKQQNADAAAEKAAEEKEKADAEQKQQQQEQKPADVSVSESSEEAQPADNDKLMAELSKEMKLDA